MKFLSVFFLTASLLFCGGAIVAHAQSASAADPNAETVTFIKAQVTEVLSSEVKVIPGTGTQTNYQTIEAKLLEGADAGKIITADNDYLMMQTGDVFYFMHTVSPADGIDTYAVSEPYRLPVLECFAALFIACLFLFGGKQGMRGLLSLIASILFIWFLLLPGILNGYSPILVSVGVSSLIIVLGSYITHGFNKTTTVAVIGMLVTILITGALAYVAIHSAKLSGFSNEEATYLNFNTHGSIDFVGLLLGSMLIGLLGVLYDAAISQAVAVEELFSVGAHLSRTEIYRRALRIGREHIGALVNTLAIAYVGVSLPLILLFMTSSQSLLLTINQEVFATELIRMMIGSIGLILAVPITTAIAVYALSLSPAN
jgi:uncharacterized membrane protein